MARQTQIQDKDRGTLAVVGAGAWGTTLAAVESGNFRRVMLQDLNPHVVEEVTRFSSNEGCLPEVTIPRNVFATTSLPRAIEGASMLLVAVPSFALRSVARGVRAIACQVPVVIATKGLEKGTGLLSIEVWREEMGTQHPHRRASNDAMVLSGPNLSNEIARGIPAVSVLAGTDAAQVKRARKRLSNDRLRLMEWHDPVGAQVAGALKNVYAVGCGLASGLGWGDNVTASMVWRGLYETAHFVDALGGDAAVITTPAGVGDFVATCTSPLSRNFSLGLKLARTERDSGEGPRGVAEGAQTASEALRRARSHALALDLLESIWSVLAGVKEASVLLEASLDFSHLAERQARAWFSGRRLEARAPGMALEPGGTGGGR